MSTTTTKKKQLKDEIYTIIRNDIPLREKIAAQLSIQVQSVYLLAVRKSTKFSLPFVLDVIADHLRKPKEQLIDEPKEELSDV
jgi:hypothetical protein